MSLMDVLFRYPQKHCKPSFDLDQRIVAQSTEGLADLGAHDRHRLIDHDLGGKTQAVDRVRRHGEAQERRVYERARQQKHGHGRMICECVGLDDESGARLTEIA